VPLWKLEDQIANALAKRDTEAAWPVEKRQELGRQLAQDRQLRDLHAFPRGGDDDDDGADALQQATGGRPGSEDLAKLADDAAYELEHGRPAPIPVKLYRLRSLLFFALCFLLFSFSLFALRSSRDAGC
jgi:hypothetical protein